MSSLEKQLGLVARMNGEEDTSKSAVRRRNRRRAADELYEALASIRAHHIRTACKRPDHKPLRFPLCADCQLDALLERADAALAKARGEA